MKKVFALVSLMVIAAACAVPPTNREADNTTNREATKPSAVMTEAEATAKEKAAWEAIKNKDYEAFGDMLAADQIEVTSEGVNDKAGTLAGVKEFEPTELTFSDWKFLPVDSDAFVITYTVNMKGKYKGKEFPPGSVRSSSAWVNRAGKWQAMYHQECDVMKMPPPPAASSKSPAKTAASPAAAASPLTLGPDAIANEKVIWDAFKAKNYDGFASALAPDSVEVEPNGVFDKPGTIKGVMEFDASKATLGDFRSVKFDEDAVLVTYTVNLHGATPGTERHTTIWVNRGGKWLALFHHGTPVAKEGSMPATNSSASPATKASPKTY